MFKIQFKFLEFLIIFIGFARATVVSQTNIKAIADSEQQLFYVKKRGGLQQIANSNYKLTGEFLHGKNAIAVDYHYPKNLLFWTTSNGEVYSCSLNESRAQTFAKDVKLVYRDERWYPASLAVDYVGDRLYIIDARTNTLRVVDVDGEHVAVLHVGRRDYKPNYLEIDAIVGYLFLLDDGEGRAVDCTHILRMNMDGSNPIIIDPPSFKNVIRTGKLTLDRINKKIIVSSRSKKQIFGIDYDGKVLGTIVKPQNGTSSMSVTRKELFWVNTDYYFQNEAFADGSVYKCEYDGTSCLDNTIRKINEANNVDYVKAIKVVEPKSQSPTAVENSGTKYDEPRLICANGICTCPTGSLPIDDNKSCKRIDQFLIYEDAKVIRGVCPENMGLNKCQAFIPFNTKLLFRMKERTGIDYDSTTRTLYYGGISAMYRVNVDIGVSKQLIYQKNVFFGPLTIDWVTNNLYYTEIEIRGNVSFYILKVARADNEETAERSSSMLWELGRVHSMAVHPPRGHLFISIFDISKDRYRIIRMSTDAKNITFLSALEGSNFFSIDYPEDKLYALNASNSLIWRSDLDGKKAEKIKAVNYIINITGFLVHDRLIYIKNKTNIYRFDKTNGEFQDEFDVFPYDVDMLADLKIHSSKLFEIDRAKNPCSISNGGCENFCFAIPKLNSRDLKKVCRCFDGVRCSDKSKTAY